MLHSQIKHLLAANDRNPIEKTQFLDEVFTEYMFEAKKPDVFSFVSFLRKKVFVENVFVLNLNEETLFDCLSLLKVRDLKKCCNF